MRTNIKVFTRPCQIDGDVYDIHVEIDLDWVFDYLGTKAARNRSKKSRIAAAGLEVTARKGRQ